jgi:amino acid adenylation domain-containing protein
MVPAAFVVLSGMPLTAHGKVDRVRLPSPSLSETDVPEDAPRTLAEEVVAGIWCEVLELPRVSRNADFFDLGGHSLLATRVVSRLRAATGVELPVRELFLSPTVAGLAAALETALSPGASASSSLLPPPPILPVPRDRDLPLSFAQERLWFLDRLAPGLAAYHIPLAVALRGTLVPEALERALEGVVRRHEALRTHFEERDRRVVQVIEPPGPWSLPRVDLSAVPGEARTAEARRLASEVASRPFDLVAGPVLRSTLLRLGPAEHVLLLCVHHIATDGWSMGVMIEEICGLYRAGVAGAAPGLPGLPIQYADFAVWQREWLRGEVLERQLGYWREKLAGAPVLELPADHPRPAAQRFLGAVETLALPPERAEGLARLARRHDATLFMVVLAALQALLARHTGQDDIVVGSPIANRNQVEIEPLIGFFVNSLVLRGELWGDPTVSGLLGAARRTALEAFSHQDLPFERLVEEMRPERRLAVNPLFQVILAVQNAPLREVALPGVSLELLDFDHPVARFDLEVLVWEEEGGLTVRLIHDAELFDRATIARLAAHFDRLLMALPETPERRLSSLPLLSEAERRELVQAGTGGPVETMDLLERIASHPAEALAVGTLTYGELRIRAGALADELRARGVGPDVPVGLHAERSPELVVGALAALLAGGAYLPLDPAHPEERLAAMIRESGVEVVLRLKDLKDCNDRRDKRSLVPAIPLVLGAPVSPDNLAYILHTSGSTGQPKGVQIPRRGLAALVSWHVREYGVTGRDRAMMVASPSFDASVWELWPYLAAGASLHVPDEETRLSPDRLLAWMAAEGITLAFLPTPLAEPFLKRAAEGVPERLVLRALLTGGDRLRRRPDPRLPFAVVNHYGPTESSVVATRAAVEPEGEGLPGIGRPIDGTRALVLDRWLGLAPAGVPGELAIGGAGLARGYLGRPDLTAERFVPDPFAERPGERVYLTGDRVRRLPAGDLEFLGRTDQQVKVRGVRIEPGEVEAALLRHPDIREAAVAVWHDTQGPRLVAWIVSGSTVEKTGVPGLRRFLAAELPEPMVPSAFVVLEALPLTRTGKVDRAALVSPASPDRSMEPAGYVAPDTPLEETLARVASEVLDGARVGMRDNFFDLGGHSLLATQLVSRLVKEHELPVSLQMVFDSATLADLADRIVQQELENADAELLDEALIDLMRDLT